LIIFLVFLAGFILDVPSAALYADHRYYGISELIFAAIMRLNEVSG
jgi:hypothetical protein